MSNMGRKSNTTSMYRVSIHRTNGYSYASTQPARFDEKSGKNVHCHVHWGVIDENLKFYPGKNYFYADIEERSKLIFPQNWDLSELSRLYGQNTVNIVNVDSISREKRQRRKMAAEGAFAECADKEFEISKKYEIESEEVACEGEETIMAREEETSIEESI